MISQQHLNYWLLFFCTVFSCSTIGQQRSNKKTDTIPFILTSHNNIVVQATLNGTDTTNLMLHTAAGSITIISQSIEKVKSIVWDDTTQVQSWGGASNARFSSNNTVQIGRTQLDHIPIWENEKSGPETDGKFGLNFFEGKVLEFDFDQRLLLIHESLPNKTTSYEKLKLITQGDFLFIQGDSKMGDQVFQQKFLIHSGYAGTILYDDAFATKSKLGEKINIIDEQELKDSYGNILKTKKGELPEFALGSHTFHKVPVGFFEGSIGRQKMSVIGGNFLKRFNFILDAKREHIYIIPNSLKKSPF